MKSVERSRDFRGPFRSKQWRGLIARFPLPTLEETVETHFPTWASFDDNPVSICSTCVKKKEKEREKEKRKFVTTLRQLYIYIYIFEQEQTSVARVYSRGKRKCSAAAFPFSSPLCSRRAELETDNRRTSFLSRKRNSLSRSAETAVDPLCAPRAPFSPFHSPWKKIGVPIAVNETVESSPPPPVANIAHNNTQRVFE